MPFFATGNLYAEGNFLQGITTPGYESCIGTCILGPNTQYETNDTQDSITQHLPSSHPSI